VLHKTCLRSRKKSNLDKEFRAALLHNTFQKNWQRRRGALRPQIRLADSCADRTGAFRD
jgi:hypothetical protein